jgi:cysteine desulfurase
MMVNNEIGTVEPIKKLADIAHSKGVLFHTDAVQAIGHICVNVKELDIDFLSSSAHKFNGPKGIGFLYIKNPENFCPLIHGGHQEFGLRAGTENVASIVGMASALKTNFDHLEQNAKHILEIEKTFLETLKQYNIDFIRNGSEYHVPGNISLSFKNVEGEMLLHRLDLKGIYISTGSACDSKRTQISHVIKSIGVSDEYANGTIRISFGKYNTIQEGIAIANALKDILS